MCMGNCQVIRIVAEKTCWMIRYGIILHLLISQYSWCMWKKRNVGQHTFNKIRVQSLLAIFRTCCSFSNDWYNARVRENTRRTPKQQHIWSCLKCDKVTPFQKNNPAQLYPTNMKCWGGENVHRASSGTNTAFMYIENNVCEMPSRDRGRLTWCWTNESVGWISFSGFFPGFCTQNLVVRHLISKFRMFQWSDLSYICID